MNSIDNMREYVLTAASVNAMTRAVLAGYIDEIEREVGELRDRDYRNGREDAEGAVEFADRLKVAVDNREDVTLWGVDYAPLPVDADGVPIHVGDVMDGYGKTIEIVEMRHGRSGWVLISRDGNGYADLKTEDAELREQIHWLKKGDILHVLTDQEYIDQCERERLMQVSIDALDKENAKLVMKLNAEHLVRQNVERENDRLRERFLDNLNKALGSYLSSQSMHDAVMAQFERIRPVLPDYLDNLDLSQAHYKSLLESLLDNVALRPSRVLKHCAGYFNFSESQMRERFPDAIAAIEAYSR